MEGPGRQTSGGGDPVTAGGGHGGWQSPGGPRGCGGHGAAPAQPLAGEEAAQQRAESRCPSGTGGGARLPRAPPGEKRAVRGDGLRRVKRDGVRMGQRRAPRHRRTPPAPVPLSSPPAVVPAAAVPGAGAGRGHQAAAEGVGGEGGENRTPGDCITAP